MINFRMNKRGIDPIIWIIIVIIILAVFAAIVFYALYNVGDTVNTGIESGSEALLRSAQLELCKSGYESGLIGQEIVCLQLFEGKDGNYYTCQESTTRATLSAAGVDVDSIDCDNTYDQGQLEAKQMETCQEVRESQRDDVKVNGVTCTEILGEETENDFDNSCTQASDCYDNLPAPAEGAHYECRDGFCQSVPN